jgi:hypothetical protein
MVFLAIFKPKSSGNRPVFGTIFEYFSRLGAYLPPLTPSTTTPCLGTPPANSPRTKQFLSRLHGLYLFFF